jgi:hypothetical protein
LGRTIPGSSNVVALLHGEICVPGRAAVAAGHPADDGVGAGGGVAVQGIRHVVTVAAVVIGHRGLVRRAYQSAIVPDFPHQGDGHRGIIRGQDGVIHGQVDLLSRPDHGRRGGDVVDRHHVALTLVAMRLGRHLGRPDFAVAMLGIQGAAHQAQGAAGGRADPGAGGGGTGGRADDGADSRTGGRAAQGAGAR